MSMDGLSLSLLLAAAGVALTHTVLGPDHYLPFLMLARARGWSRRRAVAVTVACGAGHVASSLLLGLIGLGLGLAVARVEAIESGRGDFAAWALVAFGLAYAAWGARRALRKVKGIEPHTHGGVVHVHTGAARPHDHAHSAGPSHQDDGRRTTAHGHAHGVDQNAGISTSFWALFTIFVLGPCEPLIPLFVLPASRGRWDLALATTAVFGILTIAAMAALTFIGMAGLRRIPFGPLERWAHTLAGGVIAASGLAVITLGL
ncbi:MAG TPA: hypothetical protein VFP98_02325 [Candidatus Polarisedimenticolia bacterium]|nr:hypothetical protein [Candidatus Polarisedimenticolia bacterium]